MDKASYVRPAILFSTIIFSVAGCQQVGSLTTQLQQTVGASTASKGEAPSCDPAFSLAGFFDSRPEVLIEKPAKHPQAGDLRRIAVIPPSGEGGNDFTRRFESALASIKDGGQPYFQVVAQTDLDKVMATQGFGQSGAVAPGSAAKVGRILGVQGIYIPQILDYEISDSTYKATGQTAGQCTKRTVTFKAIPKLVDVSTGQVVYAEEHSGSLEERYCPNGGGFVDGGISGIKSLVGQGGLPEGQTMMNQLLDKAMTDFVADVAPRSCMKRMNVMDDTDQFPDELAAEKFEAAVAFMKTGRYDRACPAWQTMEQSGIKTVSLYNNLAICAEIEDRLVVARDYCSKADAMLEWPNDDINLCIDTIEKRMTEQAALRVAGCGPLTSRQAVRETQQLLIDLGYLNGGAADGIAGPGTLSAVIDFQTAKGLPIEGRIDSCLLDDLRSM